ncbi:hypothetical protein CPB83DRAFT_861628 [Crepidotus variabilis]|uniref:NAD(P)-binding protein n=1 Tax=Crepidotus variabilis TaxID=179855 RepID=A0A9P6E815_9AGAR|nr:hypothetical protein CPB83DRAFT_861628 [Crepidotus variabilis]
MSATIQVLKEFYPCKSKFNVDDIPDLTGKVVIVTGANTGIGKETAKALLVHNAIVYIACRSQAKANQAIEDLKAQTGKEGIFLKLDLSDLPSIKATAEDFLSKENRLDILFNNAGVFRPPVEEVTAQGYDLQFGTNTLGPFFLTKCLLPALVNAAKSNEDGRARIVNTASSVAYWHTNIDFDILNDTEKRRRQTDMFLYGHSKLGNILFSNELARRYGDQGIVSTSLNPGNIQTDLQRTVPKRERAVMNKVILHPADKGALTQLYAGTMPECAEYNGQFFAPWARLSKLPKGTDNLELASRLWEWFEDQVKVYE